MKKIDLNKLIETLIRLQKKGVTEVEIKGTLMTVAEGNLIIASSEPQM